jgi:nucleoside-triphosphatase THEP1
MHRAARCAQGWGVRSKTKALPEPAYCAIIATMQTQSELTDSPDFSPLAAAILDDGSADSDNRLMEFAIQQQQAGLRVRGLTMRRCAGAAGCKANMVLVDIATGDEYLVSQPLGLGSSACRADTQGFARASQVLRDALLREPDLVICNRFGGLESEGKGFAAELLDIMASGIPLLTLVSPARLDAWLRFSGQASVLTAAPADWQSWLDATLGRRRAIQTL